MRGEVCIGLGSVLSFTSLMLLIFLHIGQMSTASTPKGIYMADVNTSVYGLTVFGATTEFREPLYAPNGAVPLATGSGLRERYRWGLYSYCAYANPHMPAIINSTTLANATAAAISTDTKDWQGLCSNSTAARKYKPYDAMIADMNEYWKGYTSGALPSGSTDFRKSGTLGTYTASAYYLIILATLCVFFTFVLGILRYTYTFLLSTLLAVVATIMLLIAAAMWTAMVNMSKDINQFIIAGPSNLPLGIQVTTGPGIYILWASFAMIFASILPYMISCCTYRG